MAGFYRKYFLLLGLFMILVVLINYVLDPLSFYRIPTLYEPVYSSNARFQLPGFIKHLSYDTLIVGTSMSRNFVESDVDEILDVTSLNAAIPASTGREQYLATELAIRNNPQLKQIIWEINFSSLARDPDDVEDEQNPFPYHLWDDQVINDLHYLFSSYPIELMLDIMKKNLQHDHENRDREMLYKFGFDQEPLTEDQAEAFIDIPQSVWQSNYKREIMIANFEANVLEVIKRHPDIHFTLFYPPYSIYWNIRADKQNFEYRDEIEATKVMIFKMVEPYANVSIYDFQDRKEITHKVDNYMDIAHYVPEMNRWIIREIRNSQPVANLEEASRKAKHLTEQVEKF